MTPVLFPGSPPSACRVPRLSLRFKVLGLGFRRATSRVQGTPRWPMTLATPARGTTCYTPRRVAVLHLFPPFSRLAALHLSPRFQAGLPSRRLWSLSPSISSSSTMSPSPARSAPLPNSASSRTSLSLGNAIAHNRYNCVNSTACDARLGLHAVDGV